MNLISNNQDLEITTLSDSGFDAFIEEAHRVEPDVIVLTKATLSRYSALLKRLFDGTAPSPQIIAVDGEHNNFYIYSRHEVTIKQSSDLIQVLSSKPS